MTGPEPVALTTQDWLDALAGNGVSLQVIGDGYSNMDWQWLQQWAGILAQQRPVGIRHWGEAEDMTYNLPIVLSGGDGPALTVWSASRTESTIADARERLDRFQGEANDPNAVLISLGQASEGEDVAAEMDALLDELPDVPVLLTIAPEGLYSPGVGDDLSSWAEENSARVALIDLRDTGIIDPSAEEWALTFHTTLTDSAEQEG
ncbi:hypothetical protein [Ornithinimicrobium pratense]|uniref:SGNH/GDSL hydrolase family protein n=1 Tax=Ornithinimicrobium pratense TaxID=2593973 RepID=A0A5J6V7E1_9MICO|nr:hypothetical protein [Ornithinimicrobium pratense]QFG69759.1 hypothetical protein FY030_14585 [Ornithinimicrobium pratense]